MKTYNKSKSEKTPWTKLRKKPGLKKRRKSNKYLFDESRRKELQNEACPSEFMAATMFFGSRLVDWMFGPLVRSPVSAMVSLSFFCPHVEFFVEILAEFLVEFYVEFFVKFFVECFVEFNVEFYVDFFVKFFVEFFVEFFCRVLCRLFCRLFCRDFGRYANAVLPAVLVPFPSTLFFQKLFSSFYREFRAGL